MKRFTLLFCCLMAATTVLFAQNPGNVGTANLTAWFKPDALPLGNVPNWSTTFPTGATAVTVTDTAAPYPTATNTPTGNTSNYNTTIDFTSNTFPANIGLGDTSLTLDLIDNRYAGDEGTFFTAYYTPPISLYSWPIVSYRDSRLDGVVLDWFRINIGFLIGSSPNDATRVYSQDHQPKIIAYKGNASSANAITAYANAEVLSPPFPGNVNSKIGLYFGHLYQGAGVFSGYQGYLHEVLFYNRDLSAVEILKVNTYLAIKYGATLKNAGGGTQGDYMATDGTIVWDASLGSPYHNDVFGIGRDDSEALLQKQSHAFDDTARVYIDTLRANNAANGGVFNADISYVMLGDNKGKMHATTASNLEIPAGINPILRMEREWKVTKTNFSQNFSCDFKPSASFVFNSANCLQLLVDDDGDFSNGGTTAYHNGDGTGITITTNGSVVKVANLSNTHFPNNATKYMTLATNVTVITPPATNTYCVGEIVPASGFTSLPANATYGWLHSNTAIGLAATSGTGNVPAFTATNTTSLPDTSVVRVYPALNSCPGDTVHYLIIVQPMIPQPTADTVLTCVNTSATLTATAPGGNYEWYTDTVGGTLLATGNNYTTTPLTADTSFWVQTTISGCISPRTKVYVFVGQGITADAGSDVDICSGETANLVATPNVMGNTYNWSAPSTPTIDTFATQSVTPTDTTTYTVLITDVYGCTGTDSVTVNVKPIPVAIVPTDSAYCVGDTVPSSVYSSTPAGASYTWTNTNTSIGLGANGSGNTPIFLNSNSTANSITAIISVTPTLLGCVGTPVPYTITSNPIPMLATPPSNFYCVGDVVPATNIVGTPAGVTFDWTNTDTTIGVGASGTQNLPSFVATNTTTFATTGIITLTPTANSCVGNPTNYSISISSPIIIDRIITHPTCFQSTNGKVVAIPSGGTPGYSYFWDTGAIDSIVTNLPKGLVTLTVTDANNCTQDSTFAIVAPDSMDYISFSASPKSGCSPLEVNFINTTDPNLANKYTWEFGNNLAPDTNWLASATYTTPGSYNVSLTIVDYLGCTNTLTVADFITVLENPQAHFKTSPENPTMFNPTIELEESSYPNVVDWEWYFKYYGDTLGFSVEQNPIYTFPEDSGSYWITLVVTDENTCKDTLTRKVLIRSEYALFFPNTFTPNGDGLNETFAPKGFGVDEAEYSLIIFNRWGELVFETHTFSEGWDGTYKGEMSPSGVYVWRVDFVDLNGEGFQRTGQVKILR